MFNFTIFRVDIQTQRALIRLQQMGISRPHAIRKAIQDASTALYKRESLLAEMTALEGDPVDRAEMMSIAESKYWPS
jgi:hypothetical protein